MYSRHCHHESLQLCVLMFTIFALSQAAFAQSAAKPKVENSGGMNITSFEIERGTIRVYLPDDMAAGDTVSGTVMAEPKGNSAEERTNNANVIKAYSILIAELPLQPFTDTCKEENRVEPCYKIFFTYRPIGEETRAVVLNDKEGIEVGRALLPPLSSGTSTTGIPQPIRKQPSGAVITPDPPPSKDTSTVPMANNFNIPSLGQTGRAVVILGPFDGDYSNTSLTFRPVTPTLNDSEKNIEGLSGGFGLIGPLAESPRKAVFQGPTTFSGPASLDFREGNVQTTTAYRNVAVRLSAPKTNLRTGERTILTVQIAGLAGITEPIPLQLDASGVITMDQGNFQSLVIEPSQVGPNGMYTTTRTITGQQTGGFNVTATVVVKPFDVSGVPITQDKSQDQCVDLENECERLRQIAQQKKAAAAIAQSEADKPNERADQAEKNANEAELAAAKATAAAEPATSDYGARVDDQEYSSADVAYLEILRKQNNAAHASGQITSAEHQRRANELTAAKARQERLANEAKLKKEAEAAKAAADKARAEADAAKAEANAAQQKADAAKQEADVAVAEYEECIKAAKAECERREAARALAAKEGEAKQAAEAAAAKAAAAERARKNDEYLLDNIQELGLITYTPKTNVPRPLDYVFVHLRKLTGETIGEFLQTFAEQLGGGPIPTDTIGALGELAKAIGSFSDPRTAGGKRMAYQRLIKMTNPRAKPPRNYTDAEALDKIDKMAALMKNLQQKVLEAIRQAEAQKNR